MTITYSHLADLFYNRPHLVPADRLLIMGEAISGKTGIAFDPKEAAAAFERIAALSPGAQRAMLGPAKSKPARSEKPYGMRDRIAIIKIGGTLVNRGSWLGTFSGVQSYEGIRLQLRTALTDEDVRAVLLDVDSPGGQAAGAFETAALVRQVRDKKRVVAVVDDMMASAAYMIGSAASKVVITPSGAAGSIGVVLAHFDHSKRLENAGIRPTLIHAGARKVDGNSVQPLSDDVREDLQAEVNSIYGMFVDTVAANRPSLTPDAIRGTEAAVFIGQRAIDADLADEIGDFETALAELASSGAPSTGSTGLSGVKPAGTSASSPPFVGASLAEIMALPEAAGRDDHAESLAKQGVSIGTAKAVLAVFPTKAERAARDAQEATRKAAAEKAAAEAAERERQRQIAASWDDVNESVSRRMIGR